MDGEGGGAWPELCTHETAGESMEEPEDDQAHEKQYHDRLTDSPNHEPDHVRPIRTRDRPVRTERMESLTGGTQTICQVLG